jgi:hypothetical protein
MRLLETGDEHLLKLAIDYEQVSFVTSLGAYNLDEAYQSCATAAALGR